MVTRRFSSSFTVAVERELWAKLAEELNKRGVSKSVQEWITVSFTLRVYHIM